jgi:hypothetical protein
VKAFLAVAAAVAATAPTAAQIKKDVHRAVTAPSLWATINVCNTKHHRDQIGVRGQMPALGFPAQLQMTVRLLYWDSQKETFKPIPHVAKVLSLGTVTKGTVQEGVQFTFSPPVILAGTITFQWRRNGKLLASTTRNTSQGDKGVDDGDPAGYSTATCTI